MQTQCGNFETSIRQSGYHHLFQIKLFPGDALGNFRDVRLPESRNSRRTRLWQTEDKIAVLSRSLCQPSLFERPAFCSHHILVETGRTAGFLRFDTTVALDLPCCVAFDFVPSVVGTRVNAL